LKAEILRIIQIKEDKFSNFLTILDVSLSALVEFQTGTDEKMAMFTNSKFVNKKKR
jgi:hypothetical protein